MTSDEFAENVRSKITERTHPIQYYGTNFTATEDHGTTNIVAIDRFGNAVVVTSTVNLL